MSPPADPKATKATAQTPSKSTKLKAVRQYPTDSDASESEIEVQSIPKGSSAASDDLPIQAVKASEAAKKPAATTSAAAKRKTDTPATGKGKEPPDVEITDVKPAAKRPRTTAKNASLRANLPSAASMKKMPVPTPPHPAKIAVGAIGFVKPLSGSTAAFKNAKAVVSVNAVEWDVQTKQWFCLVENQGEVLPAGATWWEREKMIEVPLKIGEEVLLQINKVWVEGVVRGVERDDSEGGWTYECDVVGKLKIGGVAVKPLAEGSAGHDCKMERVVKKGEGEGKVKVEKSERGGGGEVEQESGAWMLGECGT